VHRRGILRMPSNLLAEARAVLESCQENAAPLNPAAIQRFASLITGRVITSGAPNYESCRLIFNRAFDEHPVLIARCAAQSDVVALSILFSARIGNWRCVAAAIAVADSAFVRAASCSTSPP